MTKESALHPDFSNESERLEFTKRYIDVVIETSQSSKEKYKENMEKAFGDVDWGESSAAYIDILTNSSFFEMSKEELESLLKAKNKPYFARIDFKTQGSDRTEKHYIGKTSLYQRENQEQIIVDWRSPIANLYYEGRIGDVSYEAEGETYEGDLSLKRQYMIEEGRLEEIRDIDLTTTDELLQDSLAKSSSNRLTEIISTIQEEQNRIIRADLNRPIIVQGAAGSGKTTIALHRISYFIYNYKQHFDPRQLMILAPSNLFIDYISEALPELGVEKVRQTTFSDYVMTCLEKKLKLVEDDKLIRLIERNHEIEVKKASWISGFKGSKTFRRILDHYIEEIEKRFYPSQDFYVDKYKLYSAKKFTHLFKEEYTYMPVYRRIEKLKFLLQGYVRSNKKQMIEKVETFFDEKIEKALYQRAGAGNRKEYISKALDKKAERLEEVKKAVRTSVTQYMKQFEKKNLEQYYSELFSDPERLVEYSRGELDLHQAEDLCFYTMSLLMKKKYEVEDLAPLLYLQTHLFGIDKFYKAKNIVIDEAQDYSYMQLYTLKRALETDMFTLVGDLAQGIHSYRGLQAWEPVYKEVFPRATYTELQKSYRTTIEIMEEANKLLSLLPNEFPKVNPVVRHGDAPCSIMYEEAGELAEIIGGIVSKGKEEGFQTFAVIGKSMKDCRQIYKTLNEKMPGKIKLLEEQESIPKDRIVVVPSYLSKGLEFDVVMITVIDEVFSSGNELDIKLQYVAMTRPLHRLSFIGKSMGQFINR
ncbi:DNA helicase [[Bacillus] enclensis]|uniref:DNA helicase-2 / ATP-dependent DNA helicase PcrA n=1 Tax=[Bacillus] enclensis TaxID=1402860 RepID=A0A0V8HIP7_9BACI|nr:RNA polymerase recycling motor HelD [[Bacillus] enclensis]KSU62049.1 DNA helicase [[Bacillus] enclensis]SCB98448.1 DNA helicase-2 / ATP-dependent DNA helicase PcrA [[Bacillus] enclensis]